LHDKQLFEENPPQASEQALKQNPPLSKSTRAQEEIQSALQEIRTLAKNSTNEEEKKSVSLTSFHFTPAGEIPRAPHENKDTIPASSSNSPASNLSPRERAEQRRQGKNIPQNVGPTSSSAASPSSLRDNPSTVNASNATTPSHVRRRMGQVVSDSMLPESARSENDHPFANEKESFSKGDEDFKSLFGEKNKDDKKKKKNTQDDDEDFSLDDEGEGLELLEDK
jgi:hypothetical protein